MCRKTVSFCLNSIRDETDCWNYNKGSVVYFQLKLDRHSRHTKGEKGHAVFTFIILRLLVICWSHWQVTFLFSPYGKIALKREIHTVCSKQIIQFSCLSYIKTAINTGILSIHQIIKICINVAALSVWAITLGSARRCKKHQPVKLI